MYSTVQLRGMLQKRSPSKLKGWQKRFLVVSNYSVYYYKNAGDKAPKGIIPLSDITEVCLLEDEDGALIGGVFVIDCGHRQYYMLGQSEDDVTYWVSGLTACVEGLRVLRKGGAPDAAAWHQLYALLRHCPEYQKEIAALLAQHEAHVRTCDGDGLVQLLLLMANTCRPALAKRAVTLLARAAERDPARRFLFFAPRALPLLLELCAHEDAAVGVHALHIMHGLASIPDERDGATVEVAAEAAEEEEAAEEAPTLAALSREHAPSADSVVPDAPDEPLPPLPVDVHARADPAAAPASPANATARKPPSMAAAATGEHKVSFADLAEVVEDGGGGGGGDVDAAEHGPPALAGGARGEDGAIVYPLPLRKGGSGGRSQILVRPMGRLSNDGAAQGASGMAPPPFLRRKSVAAMADTDARDVKAAVRKMSTGAGGGDGDSAANGDAGSSDSGEE